MLKGLGRFGVASLGVVLAGTLTAACSSSSSSSSSSAPPKTATNASSSAPAKPISIAIQEKYSELPVLVAQDQGYFKQNGISSVNLVTVTTLPAMMSAVSSGQIDLGLQIPSAVANFNAKASGDSQLRFIAAGQAWNLQWIARSGAGIPAATGSNWQSTVKAWKGKTIGVPALGGVLEFATSYLAKQVGLNPGTDFQYVTVAAGQAEQAALKSGSVDVVTGDSFGGVLVTSTGAGQVVLNMATNSGLSTFSGGMESGYFGSLATLKADPKLYAGFDKALAEAVAFISNPANRAQVEADIASGTGVTAAMAATLYPSTKAFDLTLTPTMMSKTLSAYQAIGAITGPTPSYSSLVYTPK